MNNWWKYVYNFHVYILFCFVSGTGLLDICSKDVLTYSIIIFMFMSPCTSCRPSLHKHSYVLRIRSPGPDSNSPYDLSGPNISNYKTYQAGFLEKSCSPHTGPEHAAGSGGSCSQVSSLPSPHLYWPPAPPLMLFGLLS